MSALNKDKREELQEAFTMHCQADNKVALNQLGMVIRSTGCSPTQSELHQIIKDLESKGMRSLEFNQVVNIVEKHNFASESMESLKDAFRIFDKDGNGFINAAELRHVLCNLGEKLTDEEVDEMIREADLTGDGQVNYDEFVKVLLGGY
ncbi:hypothetical protein LOTGIDRAFT_219843 [Lottia gigantea]|uniref:EF-hand domain-containing protein n=1 Tax=Lottia gigantea TaxID=225164 RepID=V3ZYF4_LOTGI|nr:hypothetical protein LOTGIDRAFT_219843 [Lottia gigantea]ESO87670.1 hypothetical protein LOTGIDRAFT_219843 [Lottia gigantea]